MISVDEATLRIAAAFSKVASETVSIANAEGRVLASDAIAANTQPPEDVSSMDGYAVRASDVPQAGIRLKSIGISPAGHPFSGRVGRGETVRIFTGGVIPEGADSIIVQEDATAGGDGVTFNVPAIPGRHIRKAGLDFRRGDAVAASGRRVTARDLSLLAAAGLASIEVRRRPRVAFAATGDELSRPGQPRKPGGVVASSGYGLAAMIRRWGGEPVDLGILPDTVDAIASIAEAANTADLVVTIGGASVGDHDLVRRALGPEGFELDFWKIAMRPGKPLIFGRLGKTPVLGLPGNPVSTLVCAILFVQPALAALLGTVCNLGTSTARLARPLNANDARQDYIRASTQIRNGEFWVEPFPVQDSSMLSTFAKSDCLIVRKPQAPAVAAGGRVDILPLD
jgi:molybdopterin molybdotransferase